MDFRLVALVALLPAAALAQSPPQPGDPKAAVPPLRYESALKGYRGIKDDKPAPWKQVNEEVKGAGGHSMHAAPNAKPPAAPSQGAGPTPAKPTEHKH